MEHYKIISDAEVLSNFIETLPDIENTEVYYICLFGRHKYDPSFPNTRDSGQLARIICKKDDIIEKIRRLESPLGSYSRDGFVATQKCLAMYIGLNPRCLIKANKNLLVEMATRLADGNFQFNPITLATTEVHKATNRKFFVDFDYDDCNPAYYLPKFLEILSNQESFRILKTRGGFHLIVELSKLEKNNNWYQKLSSLPNCDVKGSYNLTPIPGCFQGDFVPYFWTQGEN